MFYSHEILTSKRYGVATVWLAATLGAKSSMTKRLNRKAILDVNVRKACEAIIQPEAPMALRLQSNLLYGVSRVYSQQCGYILADAQTAQKHLESLLRSVKHDALDPKAGKARPDELILMDDPAFMLDMAFPALDLDFSNLNLDISLLQDSQGSMLSPYSRSRRASDASVAGSVLGLVIPASDTGIGGYQLPYNDAFQLGVSSIQKMSGVGHLYDDENLTLIDDLDFGFDADGGFRNIGAEERDMLRSGSIALQLGRLGSDSAASGRVRREHEEAMTGRATFGVDGDFIINFDDEPILLPEVEASPPLKAIAAARHVQIDSDASATAQAESSSISAEAPLKKRKRKTPKTIAADQQIELYNSDLRNWQNDYLQNMDTATHHKKVSRAPALAKKSAYTWVFGNGLGDTGRGIGASNLRSPLDVFSGDKLMAAVTGISPSSAPAHSPKRLREDDEEESKARQVRARQDHEEDQRGRGGDDEGLMPILDESMGAEIGREAQSALDDHASSAMPWNISASLHSYRNLPGPGSSSIQGHGTLTGRQSSVIGVRPGSRLASASPLLIRSRADIPDIERVDDFGLQMAGFEDLDALGGEGRTLSATQADEFEIFGPAAAVDTQTAQTSQYIKEALARESLNFLEYVRNTLNEEELDELIDEGKITGGEGYGRKREVGFETLFPPESNSKMVAAQAFHHVLTLATKNLLRVKQDAPFGEIWLDIKKISP